MNIEQRIEELNELRRLVISDLKNIQIMKKKIGDTPHQEDMLNKFLDQLNEIDRELKALKKLK